jgi:protein-tyrosine kinase
MSAIERASQRLQELRRRGVQLSGQLAYPINPEQETMPSTIEKAINRLETLEAPARHGRQELGVVPEAVSDPEASGRREPKLSGSDVPDPFAGAALVGKTCVELDFAMLGARGYLTPHDSESGLANQFRKVKWPLLQACQGKTQPPIKNANRIMVTSSVPGEGKSFIALNLALSIAAERDHRVLLIDADTTRPSLSRLLQISGQFGLLDVLSQGGAGIGNGLLRTSVDRLAVMPAGVRRPHATELLASEAMARVVEDLSARYSDRLLIFDVPPLLAAPEPAVLASYMGQIIVVAEADKTTHARLKSALATIESCPVVRMILNKASAADERYSYAG